MILVELQPSKMFVPIEVTPAGRVIEVSPVQPTKALLPIVVSPVGSVTEAREVQPLNV